MQEALAPCNSVSNLEDSIDLSKTSSQTSTANSTPQMSSKLKRRSRVSEADDSIIEKVMSIERKKTLMCTEQSSFLTLHKLNTKKLPGKKFSALVPGEYQKFMIKQLHVKVNQLESIKYQYPDELAVESNIDLEFKRKQKSRSTTCILF